MFAEFPISYFDQRTRRLYSGRVDYGSELIYRTSRPFVKRLFYSCLMVYEAKREGHLDSAKGQILGYMSCVWARRKEMMRLDVVVHGIATDGYEYEFVKIDF